MDGAQLVLQIFAAGDRPSQKWYLVKAMDDPTEGPYIESSAAYTSDGNYVASITDALGNAVEYGYDPDSEELLRVTDAKGNETGYADV